MKPIRANLFRMLGAVVVFCAVGTAQVIREKSPETIAALSGIFKGCSPLPSNPAKPLSTR
jgi:hypothetical protein